MIPSWLISILAHIPSTLLVLGSTCLLLMFAIGSALGMYLLAPGLPRLKETLRHLPMAVLRTVAALACMTAGSIAAAVANLVWIRRLRAMDAYDKKDFTGKGIPREDWAAFLDVVADVLWEMRTSGRREP